LPLAANKSHSTIINQSGIEYLLTSVSCHDKQVLLYGTDINVFKSIYKETKFFYSKKGRKLHKQIFAAFERGQCLQNPPKTTNYML